MPTRIADAEAACAGCYLGFCRSARRARLVLAQSAKPMPAPPAANSAPPNTNHSPAVVFVIRMLPPLPLLSSSVVTIQPAAGAKPPAPDRMPQAASRQVASIATAKHTAASGAGPLL